VLVLADRTLVVSPHLDDAIMSLGASIARAARSCRQVTVLTVFAGNPDSALAQAVGTVAEASRPKAKPRRDVSRTKKRAPFSEADYRDGLDEDAIWSAVTGAVADARPNEVFVPGFPLTNPDHAWLRELFVERGLPSRRVGLYAEQPYRYKESRARLGNRWISTRGDLRDYWRKRRAIVAYRSQLPLLGMRHYRLSRMLLHERLHGGEAISWVRA
jgi:LmbE family N-acetylglucosaminyl deacetylase